MAPAWAMRFWKETWAVFIILIVCEAISIRADIIFAVNCTTKSLLSIIELLEFLAKKHPAIANRIKNKLNAFDMDCLRAIIIDCTKYKIFIPLTEKRAEFVCHLIESRYLAINEQIEKHL